MRLPGRQITYKRPATRYHMLCPITAAFDAVAESFLSLLSSVQFFGREGYPLRGIANVKSQRIAKDTVYKRDHEVACGSRFSHEEITDHGGRGEFT